MPIRGENGVDRFHLRHRSTVTNSGRCSAPIDEATRVSPAACHVALTRPLELMKRLVIRPADADTQTFFAYIKKSLTGAFSLDTFHSRFVRQTGLPINVMRLPRNLP
jgi:hypothetical protein